jgi:undecaprenyl-diphosphatase
MSESPLARLDRRILKFMRTRGHTPESESAVKLLAATGEWGAIWTLAALVGAATDAGRRERWLRAAAIPPLAVAANFAVKLAVGRQRPRLRGLPPLAGAPTALSFPSAHATSSFAAAMAIGRIAPATRVPLLAGATAMSLTRPYLGMHYPSDVVAGAALGTALGLAAPGLGPPSGGSVEERFAAVMARQSNGQPVQTPA